MDEQLQYFMLQYDNTRCIEVDNRGIITRIIAVGKGSLAALDLPRLKKEDEPKLGMQLDRGELLTAIITHEKPGIKIMKWSTPGGGNIKFVSTMKLQIESRQSK